MVCGPGGAMLKSILSTPGVEFAILMAHLSVPGEPSSAVLVTVNVTALAPLPNASNRISPPIRETNSLRSIHPPFSIGFTVYCGEVISLRFLGPDTRGVR